MTVTLEEKFETQNETKNWIPNAVSRTVTEQST